jgi:hypothetical protein
MAWARMRPVPTTSGCGAAAPARTGHDDRVAGEGRRGSGLVQASQFEAGGTSGSVDVTVLVSRMHRLHHGAVSPRVRKIGCSPGRSWPSPGAGCQGVQDPGDSEYPMHLGGGIDHSETATCNPGRVPRLDERGDDGGVDECHLGEVDLHPAACINRLLQQRVQLLGTVDVDLAGQRDSPRVTVGTDPISPGRLWTHAYSPFIGR